MSSPNTSILAPSILAGNHANLSQALQQIEQLPVQWLHLDIMDGHFVPNLSFGPQTVADLRKINKSLFFDTHLMLDNPDAYIEAFAKAGSDQITFHIEAPVDVAECLAQIHKLGCRRGLVINPGTDPLAVKPYLADVDIILVMTVWPGFGGQSFIDETLLKMEQLDLWRTEGNFSYRIQVDGGINLDTAARCRKAGADTFVAGTAFFSHPDPLSFIRSIEA